VCFSCIYDILTVALCIASFLLLFLLLYFIIFFFLLLIFQFFTSSYSFIFLLFLLYFNLYFFFFFFLVSLEQYWQMLVLVLVLVLVLRRRFSKFQDLITAQTDIPASNQILIYENHMLNRIVQSQQTVESYPGRIPQHPIFLLVENSRVDQVINLTNPLGKMSSAFLMIYVLLH